MNPTSSDPPPATPLYDALVAAKGHNATPAPSPAPPADTPHSEPLPAAVLDLFCRVKAIADPDGSWSGGDVVDVLNTWFAEFGIDVDDDVVAAAQNLHLPARLACDLNATTLDQGCLIVHVRTELSDPMPHARACLVALVDRLGPDTSVSVFDLVGDQIAHLLHPAAEQPTQ